jgi:hypothetical protein
MIGKLKGRSRLITKQQEGRESVARLRSTFQSVCRSGAVSWSGLQNQRLYCFGHGVSLLFPMRRKLSRIPWCMPIVNKVNFLITTCFGGCDASEGRAWRLALPQEGNINEPYFQVPLQSRRRRWKGQGSTSNVRRPTTDLLRWCFTFLFVERGRRASKSPINFGIEATS